MQIPLFSNDNAEPGSAAPQEGDGTQRQSSAIDQLKALLEIRGPGVSTAKLVAVDARQVSVMPSESELTDAKIAATEARTDTKIVRLEGKIDTLSATIVSKLDSIKEDVHKSDSYNRDTRLLTLATIAAAAIALGGLIVAMATYGDALFGRGMNVRDVVQTILKETQENAIKKTLP